MKETKEKCKEDGHTADGGTGVEGLGDVGIELDVEVLLDRQLFIPLLASLVDPCLERFPKDGENDIANICSRQLPDLPFWRKGINHTCMGQSILEDFLQRELLVLWDVDHLDLVAVDCLWILASNGSYLPSSCRKLSPSDARW